MDPATFERLIDGFLLPMLPGASRAAPASIPARKRQVVSYARAGGGNQLLLRPDENAKVEYCLSRSQKFQDSEFALAESFVQGAQEIESAVGKPYEAEVLRGLPMRVVARAAGGVCKDVLLKILEQFTSWASDQYEGRPVVSSAGIDATVTGHVDVDQFWKESFAPVLGNGMDTILIVDPTGKIASLAAVESPATSSHSPIRYAHMAGWSAGGRVSTVLNRNGEILVFTDGALRFALRRGRWHHFTHGAVVSSIHLPHLKEAKNAIYETLLDVAFARCGGCLTIVDKAKLSQVADLVSSDDLVSPPNGDASLKGTFLGKAVGSKFADLDRRVRAEIVAMDGATILDHRGTLIAAGAIVKIGPGSTGGGRLAATKELAKLGLAVKVSQDGAVTGFNSTGQRLFAFA